MADVNAITINLKLLIKLFSNIQFSTTQSYKNIPCWEWQGTIANNGYAHISIGPRISAKIYLVHRLFYRLFVEPIPTRLIMDHLCRNTRCVNPIHLEAVTHKINTARAVFTNKTGPKFKTHCKNGHPFSGDNIAHHFNAANDGSRGGLKASRRVCKQCCRDKESRRRCAKLSPTPPLE